MRCLTVGVSKSFWIIVPGIENNAALCATFIATAATFQYQPRIEHEKEKK
jgi:hypothetical protein